MLSRKAADLVTTLTPFDGYFAEDQSDLAGVTESILNRLYDSVGFIAIMHQRGTVTGHDRTITRASVWIEQEIAIAAFMGQVLKRPLRSASYCQKGIQLEGVRQFILLNAKSFTTNEHVLEDLQAVLPTWTAPLYKISTPHQREVTRRHLKVVHIRARHPQMTINVTNQSGSSISVKSVSMYHDQKRLGSGTPSEGRESVEVRPHTENFSIAFTLDEEPLRKLQDWGVVERRLPNYSFISDGVDIEVRVEYEALGEEDQFSEIFSARVHGSGLIESL